MPKPNYDNWDERKCAKKYAYDHGYYGSFGGWIYKEGRDPIIFHTREGVTNYRKSRFGGRPICQGWDNFYQLHGSNIRAYIRQLKDAQEQGEQTND